MTHIKTAAETTTDHQTRRRFLSRVTNAILAVIGGVLTVISGGAIVSPRLGRTQDNWLPSVPLSTVPDNEPMPVTLRVVRQDGYRQVTDRRTIFLVKTGEKAVVALDSTCTHLGCRVSWDADAQLLRCPCHGGAYDKTGAVKAGPPPAPLASLPTRIDDEDRVMVQV